MPLRRERRIAFRIANSELSAKFLENQANDVFAARLLRKRKLSANPDDFIEFSPGAVGARVEREAFAAVVKEVRKDNVEIALDSLAVDCAALRTGEQEIQVLVDPERAPGPIRKLKGLPGVLDTGGERRDRSNRHGRVGRAACQGSEGQALGRGKEHVAVADWTRAAVRDDRECVADVSEKVINRFSR